VTFDSSQYARESTLGIDLVGPAQALQNWCFCPSCRQSAADHGCDVEAAQQSVRSWIDRAVSQCVRGKMDDINAEITAARGDDASIRGFGDARRHAVRALITAIHTKIGDKLMIPVNDAQEFDAVAPIAQELGVRLVARHKTSLNPDPVAHAVDAMRERSDVAVRFDAYPPYIENGPALVAAVHEAVEAGHTQIGFYADGLLPQLCLDWIRQAIRYARRES
jgi:hypothetical protein